MRIRPMLCPAITRLVLAFSAIVLACSTAAIAAETEITFSGEVRVRTEADSKSFDPDNTVQEFTDLRTRLALEAVLEKNALVFIQLQDSRRLGGFKSPAGWTSGTTNDAENVDIHQAYLRIDRLFGERWGMQAGRFEVNLGNQRVFGSVGWSNVGRSWEGMDAWFTNDDVRVTGYWLKSQERNDPEKNQDFDIYGVNTVIKNAGLELLAFYERDAYTPASGDVVFDINSLDRFDIGFYLDRTFDNVHLVANGVYQFGNQATAFMDTVTETDISAYLLTAEVGYTFESSMKPSVAAGIDYASGDDDLGDDTFEAYNNLYYTGHKFRGFMDYFVFSNPEGLVDLMAIGSIAPASGWKLGGAVHYFRTAADYIDFESNSTNAVGTEIDLTATTTRIAGVTIDGGFSVFLPDDSYARESDPDTGIWGYIMLAAHFGGK